MTGKLSRDLRDLQKCEFHLECKACNYCHDSNHWTINCSDKPPIYVT